MIDADASLAAIVAAGAADQPGDGWRFNADLGRLIREVRARDSWFCVLAYSEFHAICRLYNLPILIEKGRETAHSSGVNLVARMPP